VEERIAMTRIGLDVRCGRHISAGMRTYIREVASRLPAVAPQYEYRYYDRGQNLGLTGQFMLPLKLALDRVDLTHYMAHYVPALAAGRFVFTIHDVIHLRYKEFFKAYIEPYYMSVVRRACRRAARVITSDSRTIADLTHFFGISPEKIVVVPLAPRERFLARAFPHGGERPYLINVGNHREHKDTATLLEAWSSLPARYEVDLYFTGEDDFGGELQRRSTPTRRAIALGNLTDDALASYYAGAQALVHPSLLEGFGLPFVEAMAQGCAVIATTTSIPDPVRDAALLFEPRDVEAARGNIERLLDDQALREQYVERGRIAVRALSWERTARETAAVYRDVLEEGS
jgi:glycosyltransferase involved in cell wall biosynthesis